MNRDDVPDFLRIIGVLTEHGVHFIVVGGVAANLLGSARLTYDLDIVYDRKETNLSRIAGALEKFNPYLRGAPPGLPFKLDLQTLKNGLNFTLTSDLGQSTSWVKSPGRARMRGYLLTRSKLGNRG